MPHIPKEMFCLAHEGREPGGGRVTLVCLLDECPFEGVLVECGEVCFYLVSVVRGDADTEVGILAEPELVYEICMIVDPSLPGG